MATLRAGNPNPQARADADYLLDSALRTPNKTVAAAGKDRVTYNRRFKGKKVVTGDENFTRRSQSASSTNASSTTPSPTAAPTASLASSDDKHLEVSLIQTAKVDASQAFKTGKDRKARERKKREEADRKKADRRAGKAAPETEKEADRLTLAFLEPELARFIARGAWEYGSRGDFVSGAFLVPKHGGKWRLIFDLRHLNSYCVRKRIRMETLLGRRHLTKKGDYMFFFDLRDGFDALGIAEADRDCFTVDIRGTLYRAQRGCPWLVPQPLRPERHAEKGFQEPAQFGLHLGSNIDSTAGYFTPLRPSC
eukprot:jgi/Tetstr1/439374/TSEL_027809.t1